MPAQDDLLDAVLDLQHDLGKHMRQPFAFLPSDAPPAQVREALRVALLETRKHAGVAKSARAVWTECLDGAPGLRHQRGFDAVEAAVERALAWAARLGDDTPLPRAGIEADLLAVQTTLAALRLEVSGPRSEGE